MCFQSTSPPRGFPTDEGRGLFFVLKSTDAKACSPEGDLTQPLPWQRELCSSQLRHPLSQRGGHWPWLWEFHPCSLTEESRDSKPRGGRGTEKEILLPAGLSTWSPVRQKPFSRAAAVYFIHAVPLRRQSVRLTQLLLQRFTAPARDTGRDSHTASTHGHTVSCSCCSSPALKVWNQFPHCW